MTPLEAAKILIAGYNHGDTEGWTSEDIAEYDKMCSEHAVNFAKDLIAATVENKTLRRDLEDVAAAHRVEVDINNRCRHRAEELGERLAEAALVAMSAQRELADINEIAAAFGEPALTGD